MARPGLSWARILQSGGAAQLLLSLSLLFTSVRSRLVNVTVDDSSVDPTTGKSPQYSNGQDDQWNAGSPSEDCPDCSIGPKNLNLSQVYRQTWHDTTFLSGETPVTITVQFTGSAVYVFNILANTISGAVTTADISFSIDGENVGHFTRDPDSSGTFLYNQLVFSDTGLSNEPHTLVMTPNSNSLILFDYLIYTVEVEDPPPTTSSSQTPSTPSAGLGTPSTSTSASSSSLAQPSSSSPSSSAPSTSASTASTQSSSSRVSSSTSASQGSSQSSTSDASGSTSPLDSSSQSPSPNIPSSTSLPDPATGPAQSHSSQAPIGIIAGAAAGGIALLLGAVLAIVLCRRRRKPKPSAADTPWDGASFVPSMASATSISPLRGREHDAAHARRDRDSHLPIASPTSESGSTFVTADSTHASSLRVVIPASPSTMVAQRGSPKPPSRAELAWRLEELQHTRSALSTPDPNSNSRGSRLGPDANGGPGRGTEMAIRDLEAEIASLRTALAAMNARLEDEHRDRGEAEFLPAYAE